MHFATLAHLVLSVRSHFHSGNFLSELLQQSAHPLLARKVDVSECELSGDVLMLEAPLKVAT
jgi:hypothetical protein